MEIDYEKAYKAALETATQWIKDGCTDKERICLESAFPQLRESEDERIRKWIYNMVENLGYPADEAAEKELEEMQPLALAYLDKQKERKPAEWSEEDERNIDTLVSVITEHYTEYDLVRDDYPINARGLIAWLKSLRPDGYKNCNSQWKPSEEQMKQLYYAITPGSTFDCNILYELYRQLKKLM